MDWRAYLRHLDYILIAATLGLIVYGVTTIYFATRHDIDGRPMYFVTQQLVAVAVALVAAAVVSLLDYEIYRRFQWVMYAFAVFILVVVLPFGEVVNGARRWINLGFQSFQPSALALLLLALSIGAYLADRMDLLGAKRVTLVALAMVAVPAFLVYQEPDFGSAMVMLALTLAMLYFYGTSWTHFAVLAGSGVVALVLALKVLPLAGMGTESPYQRFWGQIIRWLASAETK